MLSWYELAIPISYATSSTFSFLQNIVKSLKRSLDDFQVHLLDELQYRFNVIGVTETKTTENNPKIPCFLFEYARRLLLASGGVSPCQQSLSFSCWILAYLRKTLLESSEIFVEHIRSRLLGYGFEPRPVVATVGSAMSIGLSINGCSHSKKTV